jgi:hypothetical protein
VARRPVNCVAPSLGGDSAGLGIPGSFNIGIPGVWIFRIKPARIWICERELCHAAPSADDNGLCDHASTRSARSMRRDSDIGLYRYEVSRPQFSIQKCMEPHVYPGGASSEHICTDLLSGLRQLIPKLLVLLRREARHESEHTRRNCAPYSIRARAGFAPLPSPTASQPAYCMTVWRRLGFAPA